MGLEDQYDAWVRGLMGGGKYAATPEQAAQAGDAVQQMQAQLEALQQANRRQKSAAGAVDAVQKAGAATADSVRKMSSDLARSLKQDGLLGGKTAAPTPAPAVPEHADFTGVAEKIRAQVLGQDAFVSALVKAFRRPFVLGTAADTDKARNILVLCGAAGTGRHYALDCTVRELAGRAFCTASWWKRWTLPCTRDPRRKSCFCRTCTPRCNRTRRCLRLKITRAARPVT